jgi:hypothetical protein
VSGGLHPPLLTPAQASTLLDQVLYEQVLECIDLDALYRVEQSLVMLVGELDGMDEARIAATATAMLDRALLRLPENMRGYLRGSDGVPIHVHSALPPPTASPSGSSGDRARAGRRRDG